MGKVLTIEELVEELIPLKQKNKVIVTTNGCFDILHVGHVRYLKKSAEYGDVLIVCLNSDNSVKQLKGPSRPLNNQNDRAEVLAALGCVDYVVIFDELTPVNYLAQIRPNIHTKGGDYNEDNLPETKVIKEGGGQLKFIQFVEGKSTTGLLNKISTQG